RESTHDEDTFFETNQILSEAAIATPVDLAAPSFWPDDSAASRVLYIALKEEPSLFISNIVMGNKASLFVELDHGNDCEIMAGTSLKGLVVLNVQRKLPAGELSLRLVGTEYTVIPSRKGTKREERVIARAFTKLNGFGGTRKVSKGLYSQPFEFLLPASLPSSTQFPKTDGKNFSGRIQYRLSAEMGELSEDKVFHVISAPLGDNVVPCIAEPTSHELRQAKLLKKGFLSVGACVSNSHVGRGQEIKISLSTRNDSICDIDRVRVKFCELIEYKAQDEKAVLKNELRHLKDVDLPHLQRDRSQDLRISKKVFTRTKSAIYAQILSDLVAGENTFKVRVPTTARDSYDGNLITISHFLKVTYYTGGRTVENPSTKLPIVVGSPRSEEVEADDGDDMTTIVGEDPRPASIPDPSEPSVVSVGYDIPMAEAYIIPPPSTPEAQSPNTFHTILDKNVGLRPARILPYGSDEEEENDEELFIARPVPVPSAPHESLLAHAVPTAPPREILGRRSRFAESTQQSHPHPYAPYALYSNNTSPDHNRVRLESTTDASMDESTAGSSYQQEAMRNRFDTYSYDETTAVSELTEAQHRPQLGHAQLLSYDTPTKDKRTSEQLLDRLLRELRASIHDYEVISTKTRIAVFRELYSSLCPRDFGRIISTVGMSYQVQVAVLLARHLVYSDSFTCRHVAEAVKTTSTFFRANMVEALIPYAKDLGEHRNLIEAELSDWERCVTERAFENMK
ncbi:MAG: hypothetical protein SGILL_005658, partial [Bacillariaceae sp.]